MFLPSLVDGGSAGALTASVRSRLKALTGKKDGFAHFPDVAISARGRCRRRLLLGSVPETVALSCVEPSLCNDLEAWPDDTLESLV